MTMETKPTPKPKEFIFHDGTYFQFCREAKADRDGSYPLEQLDDDEIIISPGLIYRWMP
jgi:hypothetical protein